MSNANDNKRQLVLLSLAPVPNLYLLAKSGLWCSDQIARKPR